MSAVTVYTTWPNVKWWPNIAGVPTLYIDGTIVDTSQVSAIETAAAALGVGLSIATPPNPAENQLLTVSEADLRYEQIGAAAAGSTVIDGGAPDSTYTDSIDGGTP